MFLGFAALQYNDPDPITWILIYGAMAVACGMAAFNFYIRNLIRLQAAVYVLYAGILFHGVIDWLKSPDRSLLFSELAKMQYPYIEETREFLGLLICLGVLGWYWVRSAPKKI
jgi:Transmembrane family 220, helix